MKIVVVGAAGFIGRRLRTFLGAHGHEVLAFDVRKADNVFSGSWSLSSPIAAECRGADAIVHLAAWPYEGASFRAPTKTYQDGLVSLASTCEIAAKHSVAKVVFASTISVYGDGQGWAPPWSENVPPRPKSPYGHSKLAGEHLLACMAQRYKFAAVPLRLGQIYGPGMTLGDRGRAVIAIFMSALMRGEPMPLVGDGNQRRSFLHVDDLCPAIEQAILLHDWGLGPVNVASPEPVSIRTLAQMVAETGGFSKSLYKRPGGIAFDAFLDPSRAVAALDLDWRPLVVGLKQTWEWAREQETPTWQDLKLPLDGVKT